MGDFAAALSQLCSEASGGGSVEVIAVHGDRFPRGMRSSLRVRGATLLDAGPKRGSVDGALKGYWNDLVVDALLLRGGGGGSGGAAGCRGWLFVASGDKDFSDDVRRAQRAGFRVGIIYGEIAANDFLTLGDVRVPWKQVVVAAERIAAELLQRGVALEPPSAAGEGGGGGPPSPTPPAPPTPLTPGRSKSPVPCRDFQNDRCWRTNCRFAHIKVGGEAAAAPAAATPAPASPPPASEGGDDAAAPTAGAEAVVAARAPPVSAAGESVAGEGSADGAAGAAGV
jgi:hypothetical protein